MRSLAHVYFFRQNRVKIQDLIKPKQRVNLLHLVCLGVISKSVHLNLQDWWQFLESQELSGVLLAVTLCFVLIVASELFCFYIVHDRVFYGVTVGHAQLEAIKRVSSAGLVFYVKALDHTLGDSLEQIAVCSTNSRVLHLLLQSL